jgi:hypothetical protein
MSQIVWRVETQPQHSDHITWMAFFETKGFHRSSTTKSWIVEQPRAAIWGRAWISWILAKSVRIAVTLYLVNAFNILRKDLD